MTSIYTLEGKKKKPTFYTWDHRKNLPDQDACEVIKGSFKELFKKAGTKPKWHERSKIGLWFSTLFGSAAKKVLKRMEYTKFQQREKSAWYLRNKVALWFGTVFRNENVKKIRTSE